MKISFVKKIAIVLTLIIFSACGDDDIRTSSIPYARVEIDINTILNHNFNNAYYSQNYYPYKNGISFAGYVGVIVVSNKDASWVNAFELCCPHDFLSKIELIKKNDVQLECPKCNSVFYIGDDIMSIGSVVSGPSKEGLKMYRVSKSDATYRIRN